MRERIRIGLRCPRELRFPSYPRCPSYPRFSSYPRCPRNPRYPSYHINFRVEVIGVVLGLGGLDGWILLLRDCKNEEKG